MIRLDSATITQAFKQHMMRYGQGSRAWDIPYHIGLWKTSDRAFTDGTFTDFERLYDQLRGHWQAFRGPGSKWTAEQVFTALGECDQSYRCRSLSELGDDGRQPLAQLLDGLSGLKVNKSGPSIVAISKFLHFWNPRLFVIVDRDAMWNWVFRHSWIWQDIRAVRERTDAVLHGEALKRSDEVCDLGSYLAILMWAGDLVRANPDVLGAFAEYLDEVKGDEELLPEMYQYQAAAVEWLLLGLVEQPPAGVQLRDDKSAESD